MRLPWIFATDRHQYHHQTILARNGSPGEDMAAYHEARARGGAGLIIVESSRPYSDDVSASYYIDSSTDACIPGYRMLADAVHKLGVEVIPYARFFGADGDTAYFQHTTSGKPIVCENMDTLVIAQGHQSDTTLEQELVEADVEVHLVGDCLSPRSAEEAVYEGLMVARSV